MCKCRVITFLVAAAGLAEVAPACEARAADVPHYVVDVFRPPAIVYSITADRDGYMWLGTREGIYSHDGLNLTAHPVHGGASTPPYWVYWFHSLTATTNGDLWLGLGGGRLTFSRVKGTDESPGFRLEFDEQTGSGLIGFPAAKPDNPWIVPRTERELPIEGVWSLAAGSSSDELWIGTTKGLVRYHAGKLTTWTTKDGLPDSFVISVLRTADDIVYVGTAKGLARLVHEHIEHTPIHDPVTALSDSINSHANIWVGGPGGLESWSFETGGAKLISRYGRSDGLPSEEIRAIARTGDVLWIGTAQGLARLHDNRIDNWAGRLADDSILSLAADKNNDVWVGTTRGGAAWIHKRSVAMLEPADAPTENVRAIVRANDDTMWVSKQDHLAHFEGNDQTIPLQDLRSGGQLPPGMLGSLATDSSTDSVWVAHQNPDGSNDLLFVNAKGSPVPGAFALDTTTKNVRPVVSEGRDLLWVGDEQGLAKYKVQRDANATPTGLELMQRFTTKQGFCPGAVLSIAVTKGGDVWAGSGTHGATRIRSSETSGRCFKDPLPALPVTALLPIDDETLWMGFGNDGGLGRLMSDGRFAQLTAEQGLYCDNISAIAADAQARLWLGCHGGIGRAMLADLNDVADGHVAAAASVGWSTDNGMRVDRCSSEFAPALNIAANGMAWVATPAGVAVVNATLNTSQAQTATPPRPRIESITNAGRVLTTLTGFPIKFDGPTATLDIRWSAPIFAAPDGLSFEWKLSGNDVSMATPKRIGGNPRILLFDLKEGEHSFCVRTFLAGNSKGSEDACVDFEVFTPWHRKTRLLFGGAAGVLLIAGAAGWLWHLMRMRRLAQRHALIEEERSRIARDLHDSLGQGMTTIAYHVGATALALGTAGEPPAPQLREAREIIGRTRQLVDHCREVMRSSLWDLRSSQESRSVEAAVHLVVQNHRSGLGSMASVAVKRDGPTWPASALLAQELAAFTGEALANAEKHGQAKHIVVRLNRAGLQLELAIKDDGVGFVFSDSAMAAFAESGHFGLVGMGERARRLGADMEIVTAPGAGTEIKLHVPLNSFEKTA